MKDISCSRSVTLIITKGGKWKVSVNGVEIILTKSSFCRTAGTCMQRPATSSIVFIFKIKSNQKISLHLHSWSSYVYSFCFKKWGKVQTLFISIHCYILVDRWRWNMSFTLMHCGLWIWSLFPHFCDSNWSKIETTT